MVALFNIQIQKLKDAQSADVKSLKKRLNTLLNNLMSILKSMIKGINCETQYILRLKEKNKSSHKKN